MSDLLTTANLDQLHPVEGNEFIPSISRWITLGGIFLVSTFGVTLALTAVLNYKETVKAPATIHPVGDLRLVQAAMGGTIQHIDVEENQVVTKGEAIAHIDDSRLQIQRKQLQGDIQQKKLQLAQITAQINTLNNQIVAESSLSDRNIAGAKEELISRQRQLRDQQINAEANLEETAAALNLAKEELGRYQTLADTGAIPRLQIAEKETSVKVAAAKMKQAEAALDPTDAEVAMAKEQIAQEQARKEATLATLRQQTQQLLQNRIELQDQLHSAQKQLQQVETDLSQSVIRAATGGTLLQLKLRNHDQVVQPGEVIAYIAPMQAPLVIKTHVDVQDIDKVKPGQKVQMQVSACPYPDYGTLKGTVKTVAPDALPATNGVNMSAPQAGYEVTIQPKTMVVGDSDHVCHLQAGMEGKANIITREETVLKFILRKARLLANV